MKSHRKNVRKRNRLNRIAVIEKLDSRELMAADLRLLESGLKEAINSFQTSLNAQTLGASIPLVGKALSSELQAQVFSQISNALNGNTATSGNTIQQVTDNLKGSLGTKLSSITSPSNNADSIITFDISLSDSVSLPVSFDTGLPSLGLKLNGNVLATISYSFAATVGVDANGFFLDTTKKSGFTTPELDFGIDVTAAGLSASGSFGLLKVSAQDAGSRLKGSYKIDLVDLDGKLRANSADLSALDLQSRFTTTASQISLGLNAEFGGGSINPKLTADVFVVWPFIQADPEASTSSFGSSPSIAVSNVKIDASSVFTSLISPMLDKVASAAQPLIDIANGFNKKVFPSDSAINITYLDIIKAASNLGTTTGFNAYADLLALLKSINESSSEFAFFDTIDEIAGFVGLSKSASASGTIDLGSFTLGDLRGVSPGTTLTTTGVTSPAQTPTSVFTSKASSFNNGAKKFSKKDGGFKLDILEDTSNAFKLFLGDDSAKLVSFAMPTYNKSFFKSYNLNAVIYVVPVNVSFSAGINAAINFAAGLDAKGLKEFVSSGKVADIFNGFYIDSSKPILSITGIDNLGNITPDFLQVSGRVGYKNDFSFDLSDKLGFDFGIAASVEGSALAIAGKLKGARTSFGNFGIDVGFNDPDGDKRYRLKEMGVDVNQGLQCIFNVSGGIDWSISAFTKLEAGIRVKVDVCEATSVSVGGKTYCIDWKTEIKIEAKVIDHTWDEKSGPLFELDVSCDANTNDSSKIANPKLATLLADGTLRLNVGVSAIERNVSPNVIDESYNLRHDGGNPSDPGGESITVLAFGAIQSFVGVKRIQADADIGKDFIQLAKAILAPADLNGGAGDDTLYLGSGGGTLRGGSESDRLFGGAGIDNLYGGSGEDFLNGGGSGDFLFGEGDKDELFGEDGNDQLTGEQGNDIIDGGNDRDTLVERGDVSFQLSDTRLVGIGTDTLRSIEIADLSGGVSANTMQVADWSGTARLRGLSGNDVYDVSLLTFGSTSVSVDDSQGALDKLFVQGTFLADTLDVSTGLIKLKSQRVTYSGVEDTSVNGLADADDMTVSDNTGTNLRVIGESGDDTIRIGVGTLSDISQPVTIISGTNRDTVIANDSVDSLDRLGTLGLGLITGLGLGPNGIAFDNTSEIVNILLGKGADSFLVTDVLFSSLDTGTGTSIFGGPGNDSVVVGDSLSSLSGDLDRIQSRLTIVGGTDDGGSPSSRDSVVVSDRGKAIDFDYQVTGQGISDFVKKGTVARRTFAGVLYDPTIEYVSLDGTDRDNRFNVFPSSSAELKINGNLPLAKDCPPGQKDYLWLSLDSTAGGGGRPVLDQKITFTSIVDGRQEAGFWAFSSGHQLVGFNSIERFNFLDKLTVSGDAAWNPSSGVGVSSPVINSGYSNLVTNFTSSDLAPFSPNEFPSPVVVGKDMLSNLLLPSDVNFDGNVSPLDALVVINYLNRNTGGSSGSGSSGFLDVNNDGNISPLDALLVINTLNGSARPSMTFGGVRTSVADLNCDGVDEVIAVSGANHIPTLLVFNGVTGQLMGSPQPLTTITDNFGTNIAAGDIDGDGKVEIITSSDRGPGTYSIWRWENGLITKIADRTVTFSTGYLGGVRVATGDLNGDGNSEIIVGSGTGADASVRAFDSNGVQLSSFLVAPSFGRGGVYVATGDYNGDGRSDLFVSSGRRGNAQIQVFDGVASLGGSIASSRLISSAYTGLDAIAPISISLKDSDGDEEKELYSSQLSDGRSDQLKKWEFSEAADAFFSTLQSSLDPDWSSGAYLG